MRARPTTFVVLTALALLWPREAQTTRVREEWLTLDEAASGSIPVVGKIRAFGKLRREQRRGSAKVEYTVGTVEVEVVRTLIETTSFKPGDVLRLVDPAQEESELAGALYRQIGLSKHGWIEQHYRTSVPGDEYAVGKTLVFFVGGGVLAREGGVPLRYLSCGEGYERLALEKRIAKIARAHPGGPTPGRAR